MDGWIQSPVYFKHAGFIVRFVAAFIDGILLFALILLLSLFIPSLSGNDIKSTLMVLFFFLYNIAFVSWKGATVGKIFLKIKVVNCDYGKLGFGRVLLRETVGRILSAIVFYSGYLWIVFDENKKAWHDKLSGSYVIYTKPLTYDEYIVESRKSSIPLGLISLGLIEVIFLLPFAFVVNKL